MNESNNDEELVSIIMPAYCASTLISESIESVLSQTYQNWELIIADDCSKDNTVMVINKFVDVDPRVKLVALQVNGGPAKARNAALEIAKGRYIAFLDSDDYWLAEKLERSIKVMNKQNVDFIYTAYKRITSDGKVEGRFISVPESLTYNQLLANSAIMTSSVVYDAKKLGILQMADVYYDDFACWLALLKKGARSFGIPEDLIRYRVTGGHSVSGNKFKSAKKVWHQLRNYENLGLLLSIKSFAGYSVRAFIKHRSL